MKQIEFTIKSKPNLKFRNSTLKATELLALQTQISFDNINQTETLFNYILEHVEVEIAGTWCKLKEKNREIYYPIGIENEIQALNEIIIYFLNDILKPIFTKSNESSQKQQ